MKIDIIKKCLLRCLNPTHELTCDTFNTCSGDMVCFRINYRLFVVGYDIDRYSIYHMVDCINGDSNLYDDAVFENLVYKIENFIACANFCVDEIGTDTNKAILNMRHDNEMVVKYCKDLLRG